MKKAIVGNLLIFLLLFSFSSAFAQVQGKFWFGGLGAYLNYKEKDEGVVKDKDYGWLPGFEGGFLLSERNWILRIIGRWTGGNATYDGQTQGGIPVKFDNEHETIWSIELNYGYTIQGLISFTPYFGIGYRKWIRGKAQLVEAEDGSLVWDYEEVYKWGYVPIGMVIEKRISYLKIGIDGAVLLPFSMKMTAHQAEIGGSDTDYDLGWHVGAKCEIPIAFYVKPRTAFYIKPFYRYWNIKKSNLVLVESTITYEPHSITHFYGVSCGVIFEF
ncbi:MAG TPA: hypothetical protein ENF30_02770 [Candidatus Desulfofervidus auxilii]|uniref:Outer membrane protein beta-barrel domain-containing protein n=1 Tax=Desulfofervidus auxilii TaxID=1621989 RepID=A0A7V0IAH1_DESA2|nr:hypothetical protein [Candidatus Desulfofervidus auxilii]